MPKGDILKSPKSRREKGFASKTPSTTHQEVQRVDSIQFIQTSSLISYDEEGSSAVVKFILPQSVVRGKAHNWSVIHITKSTTGKEVKEILMKKESALNVPEGISLYEVGIQGPVRILDSDVLFERCRKWVMHGTDRNNQFLVKVNLEFLKFYLNKDEKSFWVFRVSGDTKAEEICEAMSQRFDLTFRMYEKLTGRLVPDESHVLFIYFKWKETNERFILKSIGPRIEKKVEETLPLDIGEEGNEAVSIGELAIEDRWKIDLADLKLHRVIGGGNFAQVMSATYKGETVAVKKMINTTTYEMKKYVQRELNLLQKLQHPNILKFIGACQTERAVFLVTEFISKGDLRTLLDDETMQISWGLRVKMAGEVADALNYFLSQDFIHRDLKTANLLIQPDFTVKLCDFGLARDNSKSKFKTLVGTDEWMAPEVIMGDDYDESADIFSFGMVLVEIITRKKPPQRHPRDCFEFPKDEFLSSVPEDTPEDFLKLSLQCLEYESKNRPPVGEILSRLKALQKQFVVEEVKASKEQ